MRVDFKNPIYYCVPCAGLLLTLFIYIKGGADTQYLWREGLLVETISALGYAVGFTLFLYAFYKAPKKKEALWFMFWALLCFICFGEETSWLQHYIGYATPEPLQEINTQEEFNLHNLNIFQSHSLSEELGWKSFLTAQHLFQIGFLGYFLIFPLFCMIKPVRKLSETLYMPIPGICLMTFIWVPIIISVGLAVLSLDEPQTKRAMAELREMFFGLGMGMFAVCLFTGSQGKLVTTSLENES